MLILPDKQGYTVLRGVVTRLYPVKGPAEEELHDLFADMGIGRGLKEYERGKKMLAKWEYNWLDYGQAVIELAKWCEV